MRHFVLVHGAWSDSAAWAAVAARLRSAGHQVAAPDLRAHGGDSTPAPQQLEMVSGTGGVAATRAGDEPPADAVRPGRAAALLDLTT